VVALEDVEKMGEMPRKDMTDHDEGYKEEGYKLGYGYEERQQGEGFRRSLDTDSVATHDLHEVENTTVCNDTELPRGQETFVEPKVPQGPPPAYSPPGAEKVPKKCCGSRRSKKCCGSHR